MGNTRLYKVVCVGFPVTLGIAAAIVVIGLVPTSRAVGDEKTVAVQSDSSDGLHQLDVIKQRILGSALGPVDTVAVGRLMDTLRADGSWPDIDYQDQSRSGWKTPGHLGNVFSLAQAYRSPHSKLHGNGELRGALEASLDYWLTHDFENSNWWYNQIGVPRSLAPVLLLMGDELSDPRRKKGLEILRRAKIGMTGQNLVWVTEITALRGILERNPELVAAAYRRVAQEISVGTGEGIQPDFSFHQHGPCLYSHGYGAAFVVDCTRIATQVTGTRMAFPPEKITLLSSLLLDGSQWMARGSTTDFGAEGREITRNGQMAGHLATAALNMLKLPTGREEELRAMAARAADRPAPPLEGNRHFWRSDMMTHHRAAYYTSARMFSSRLANTDNPCNSEGLLSHHLADGCNIVLRTGREYDDIFPVWDWQKIPGTTVEQKRQLTGSPRSQGTRSFVGGVSDGTHGLAAFDFAREALSARKSWFFFDSEYVCLGAGITCGSNNPVLTTVNQCNLAGDVAVGGSSSLEKLDRGVHSLENPAWIWHDQVGYVFLQPTRIGLVNELQRGSRWEMNHRYSKDEVTREVFTAWIDHGTGPRSDSYAYLVVPGVDQTSTAARAAESPLEIVANQPSLQAVWHKGLKIAGAAFYEPAEVTFHPDLAVGVDTPCLVLLRETPDELVISMSNPENKPATVRVEVNGEWGGEGVEVVNDPPRARVTFDLPGKAMAGSSLTRTLARR